MVSYLADGLNQAFVHEIHQSESSAANEDSSQDCSYKLIFEFSNLFYITLQMVRTSHPWMKLTNQSPSQFQSLQQQMTLFKVCLTSLSNGLH
jgi:hypothetical protein